MQTLRFISSSITALGLAAAVAACGGNDAAPSLIGGGGVSSGDIDGRVNVYVIDEDTKAPIAGAKVRVGAKIEGTTDATGLFIAKGDLSGKQTIAAVAGGHVPTLWVGVNGANVTIPVPVTSVVTVAQAELDGTIDNWATLPAPSNGHATVAVVLYSQTTDFGSAANSVAQPTGGANNLCFNSQFGNPGCNFRVNSRTGAVALFATITDRDLHGTPATLTDDTAVVTGFAVKSGLAVNGGVNQQGITLTSIAAGDTTTAKIDFGTPPAALSDVGSFFAVDLGDPGLGLVMRDPLKPLTTMTPATNTVLVPKTSAFSGGATYRVIALAQQPGGKAQSLVLKHGLSDASNVVLGDWLATPTGLMASGDTMSFAGVSGANLIGLDVSSSSGTSWSVAVLDGSTSVTIPTDLAAIPSGSTDLKVTVFDASIDVNDFNLAKKFDLINRMATDALTFTR
jgi:hypothetical protein